MDYITMIYMAGLIAGMITIAWSTVALAHGF
jgi:hypothetical protein